LAYYNRALIYQRQKKIKLAKKDVEKVIEFYPDFVDGYKLRASLKQQLGDYRGAQEDNQTAEIINNTKLNITDSLKRNEELNIAKVTSFSGNNANKNVQQIANNQISLIPPFYLSLLASNKDKRIIDSWNKKNKSFSAYFLLNTENEDISEELKNEKLQQINDKINSDNTNGELYLKRAIVYNSLQLVDKAILDFNTSLRLDPDNYMTYFGRANRIYLTINQVDTNDNKEALNLVINDYNKCIEINPNYTYAYFNRAYIKFQKEDYVGAIEDYSEVINKSSSFAEAYLNRALILLILDNKEQACKDLSKAGELGIEQGYSLISKYCNQ